jgi:hypothetical protein
LRKPEPQYAEIGAYRIRLPVNGQLLNYKDAFHLYDTALAKIACVLYGKYPELHAIRRHGVAVYYFDVCALPQEDADLVPEIRSLTQR